MPRYGLLAAELAASQLKQLAQGFVQALPILAENVPLARFPGARIPQKQKDLREASAPRMRKPRYHRTKLSIPLYLVPHSSATSLM